MRLIREIREMQTASRAARRQGLTIGFVPTMGALHEGHISLVRRAHADVNLVVVSIFVNPLQFGPSEDFTKYPRTLEADCARLEAEGVEIVFAPSPAQMFPAGASTVVHVEGLSEKLDGRSRPGHFRGVSTVVAKLLHVVQPDIAVFGQKDAAQVAVLRRMVRDLNMDVQLIVAPIVRETDGLALSSRNAYLTAEQRRQALVLHRALMQVEAAANSGETRAEQLRSGALSVLASEPAAKLDFFTIVDPDTLEPIDDISQGALAAVAAEFGATRLIDNLLLPKRHNRTSSSSES
jgi:pantoate--beta-alanine ligase